MQRLQLEHHGEFWGALNLVFYDVTGDFRRQSEWKPHMLLNGSERRTIRGRDVAESWQEKRRRSHRVRGVNPAATDSRDQGQACHQQPEHFPIHFHNGSMRSRNYACNY